MGLLESRSRVHVDSSQTKLTSDNQLSLIEDTDRHWLRLIAKPQENDFGPELTIGDAFCGGGVFSLGVSEGLRRMGYKSRLAFGIDIDKDAIETFAHNHPESLSLNADILSIVSGEIGAKATTLEKKFIKSAGGGIDILVGGPPCQGHSDLNNHTRRDDPKNALYLSMARLAELLKPSLVIIENVPGVIHDKGSIVSQTQLHLEGIGYCVEKRVIDLVDIGVPQKRRRFVLVASLHGSFNFESALNDFQEIERPISWAIEDLLRSYDVNKTYDSSANHSTTNKQRIQYLFAHDLHELPNEQRPPCHRDKSHSYKSVYGRLYWNKAAPTITGGFGSTGQGRFVHPQLPRTLTPHEASRIQFIPDFFQFPTQIGRRSMQQIIGNAAPPKLSWMIVAAACNQGLLK